MAQRRIPEGQVIMAVPGCRAGSGTGLVMSAVPAVRPMIEVDAVFAVATA